MLSTDEILKLSRSALIQSKRRTVAGRYIDTSRLIPSPFLGSGPIKLVIVGQDPTVARTESRDHITTVLNLNNPSGALFRYLNKLCNELGLDLRKNVYATNACKCFFTQRPTTIKTETGVDVLREIADIWLPILKIELEMFPKAKIISLGQPVLSMLVREGGSCVIRDYWGYTSKWRDGIFEPFFAIEVEASTVNRRIHPFVHQPTIRGARSKFYRLRRSEYVEFIRRSRR
jgi:uracil-DNA glycosylase